MCIFNYGGRGGIGNWRDVTHFPRACACRDTGWSVKGQTGRDDRLGPGRDVVETTRYCGHLQVTTCRAGRMTTNEDGYKRDSYWEHIPKMCSLFNLYHMFRPARIPESERQNTHHLQRQRLSQKAAKGQLICMASCSNKCVGFEPPCSENCVMSLCVNPLIWHKTLFCSFGVGLHSYEISGALDMTCTARLLLYRDCWT